MNPPLSIIIVDNEPLLLEVMSEMIETLGHNVIARGNNGLEAVSLYEQHRPDLLMMDYDMPHMDGIQAAQKIKTSHPTAHICICSGSLEYTNVMDPVMKIVDLLPKPVSRDQLSRYLTSVSSVRKSS